MKNSIIGEYFYETKELNIIAEVNWDEYNHLDLSFYTIAIKLYENEFCGIDIYQGRGTFSNAIEYMITV